MHMCVLECALHCIVAVL